MNFSLQSTEYRDSSMTKRGNLTDVDGLQSSLSADDSADLFCEDSGKFKIENNFQYFVIYFVVTTQVLCL